MTDDRPEGKGNPEPDHTQELRDIILKIEDAEKRGGELRRKVITVYALTLNRPTDFVLLIDWRENITAVSPNTASFLGYKPLDLIGTALKSLVHPDDMTAIRKLYKSTAEKGSGHLPHLRFKHKEGNYIDAEMVAITTMVLSVTEE